MIPCTFLLLPVIFSIASARFHIQELKPSLENVQDVKHYSDALNLLRNLVSALQSKPLENEELTETGDQKSNSGLVKTSSLENEEIRLSKLVPVRSLRPVKVYSEEIQPFNLVTEKFSTSNEESAEIQSSNLVPVRSLPPIKVYSKEIQPSNLVPDKFSSYNEERAEIQSLNLVPVRSSRPVKVYTEEVQPSNLVPDKINAVNVESEEIQPSNLVLNRSLRPVKIYSKRKQPPNLVPVKVSSLESEETQPLNLGPIRSLRPVKVYSEEIQTSNFVPVKEGEETLPSDLIPVNSLRGDVLANKDTLCETDKFYFQICTDTCKRAVHQACRNYNCDSEYTIKDACEKRCQWRYPSLSK